MKQNVEVKERSNIDITRLSEEELMAALKRKQEEKKEHERLARSTYEQQRDLLVQELVQEAEDLHKRMVAFKTKAMDKLESFREAAKKYGDIRSSSKGGFGLRNSDQTLRVVLERNTKTEYDERANLAEQLLKDFLEDKVKKKDLQTFRTINALMTRNKKTGDFNNVSINSLLAIEDNYNDERWMKAMQLFRESFNNVLISMSVSFYKKDEHNKDGVIPLTFASL